MRYQLINQPNKNFSTIQQILYNRGILEKDILHYINLTDEDINSPLAFGEQTLRAGASILFKTIAQNLDAIVIVDSDTDGYTAAALLINYLYELFPTWVLNHVDWYIHDSKQHGLNDCIDYIITNKKHYKLVICPDSASNDIEHHKTLKEFGAETLVLDHHLADSISPFAVVINNQLCDYPNKDLSGVGVAWQFCRYIDTMFAESRADKFLDLVALGLVADMVSLHSPETRYLITKGFKKENIKNPFIDYMIDKNSFPLSKADYQPTSWDSACTPMGAAFFIVPLVNAITRSGTQQEKELLLKSMINHLAFEQIPSNKRGHRPGETQQLVIQAIRTVTNVKNRQTRLEDAGLELLQGMIARDNMLNHKILLFLLRPGQIPSEIRGLIANKFMAKYQRPCCILTLTDHNTYEGSMRGYTKTGIDSFKHILERCPETVYVQGHQNAAGLGIDAEETAAFLYRIDKQLQNIPTDPIYRVDYCFNENDNNNSKILEIANMNDYWGQDIERAYIKMNFKITNSNFQVMKNDTIKFTLPHNLSIIKFGATEEEIERFTTNGFIELDAICKCCKNEWGGNISPQLILQDYNIIDSSKYFF